MLQLSILTPTSPTSTPSPLSSLLTINPLLRLLIPLIPGSLLLPLLLLGPFLVRLATLAHDDGGASGGDVRAAHAVAVVARVGADAFFGRADAVACVDPFVAAAAVLLFLGEAHWGVG